MSEFPALQIRRVPLESVIDLRHRVLRAGLPRDTAIFDGDTDPTSVHIAVMGSDVVVGCATVHRSSHQERPACQLRGMAVEIAYRRHGVGRLLLGEVDRIAAEAGVSLLWANCRTPAVPFYRAMGWEAVSDEFVIATAGPHFRMIKRLS